MHFPSSVARPVPPAPLVSSEPAPKGRRQRLLRARVLRTSILNQERWGVMGAIKSLLIAVAISGALLGVAALVMKRFTH